MFCSVAVWPEFKWQFSAARVGRLGLGEVTVDVSDTWAKSVVRCFELFSSFLNMIMTYVILVNRLTQGRYLRYAKVKWQMNERMKERFDSYYSIRVPYRIRTMTITTLTERKSPVKARRTQRKGGFITVSQLENQPPPADYVFVVGLLKRPSSERP